MGQAGVLAERQPSSAAAQLQQGWLKSLLPVSQLQLKRKQVSDGRDIYAMASAWGLISFRFVETDCLLIDLFVSFASTLWLQPVAFPRVVGLALSNFVIVEEKLPLCKRSYAKLC